MTGGPLYTTLVAGGFAVALVVGLGITAVVYHVRRPRSGVEEEMLFVESCDQKADNPIADNPIAEQEYLPPVVTNPLNLNCET